MLDKSVKAYKLVVRRTKDAPEETVLTGPYYGMWLDLDDAVASMRDYDKQFGHFKSTRVESVYVSEV